MSETGKWEKGNANGRSHTYDSDGYMVPVCYVYRPGQPRIPVMGENSEEDAELIVRAVNCLPGLLEYAQGLLEIMEGSATPRTGRNDIFALRKFIAEAEGGGNG